MISKSIVQGNILKLTCDTITPPPNKGPTAYRGKRWHIIFHFTSTINSGSHLPRSIQTWKASRQTLETKSLLHPYRVRNDDFSSDRQRWYGQSSHIILHQVGGGRPTISWLGKNSHIVVYIVGQTDALKGIVWGYMSAERHVQIVKGPAFAWSPLNI